MKRIAFLSLVIALLNVSCSQDQKSPVTGAWQLISGKTVTPDTVIIAPASVHGDYMKIIGEKHFATIWQDLTIDPSNLWHAGFNGGTYTLEDEVYTESLEYFSEESSIGGTFMAKVEFSGDTMILTYIPEDSDSKVTSIEKWKRLE